jgi:glycosyltransferase involved in cell wall biosynthesis
MKILVVIQCTNLGGMEQCALLFMEELKRLGIECELISLNRFGELEALLNARGIPARDLPYRGHGGWRSFWQTRRMLRSTRADGIIMFGHNLMAMAALDRRLKRRSVLSMHFHHRGVKPGWAWRLIYRLAADRFRAIVYASHFICDEAIDLVPDLKDLSRVISFPIPLPPLSTDETRREARQRLGIPPDVLVVGNAGWLIPRKRWDVFLDVAENVASRIPEAHFLIAGDGPEQKALAARARDQGIDNRIHWLGWQKNLTDFYHCLDVMLFNSDWDAMGRTPLEAMAHGIPTVASVTHGGLKEMLNDPRYAVYFPTHDIGRLADVVVKLLRDRQAARAMGIAGRARIEEVGSSLVHTLRVLKVMGFQLSDIPNQAAIKGMSDSSFNAL